MRKKLLLIFSIIFSAGLLSYLFFFHSKNNFAEINIKFLPSFKNPCTEIEIEGTLYLLEIDLGSDTQITLRKEILEKIKKEPHGKTQWKDYRGNIYESLQYVIPTFKMGKAIINTAIAKEESNDFLMKNAIFTDSNNSAAAEFGPLAGRIGLGLFKGVNICLDFPHSALYFSKNLRNLKKKGYSIDTFQKFPFKIGIEGIIFEVKTDLGILNLSVDTGATLTMIKPSLLEGKDCKKSASGLSFFISNQFIIGTENFASQEIFSFSSQFIPFSPNVDGFIGMDFLKNHIIYFDFQKNKAFIAKVKK